MLSTATTKFTLSLPDRLKILPPLSQNQFDHLIKPAPASVYFAFRLGEGEDSRCIVTVKDPPYGGTSVHRGDFLRAMVAQIPRQRIHYGKQLKSVEHLESGRYRMYFEDSTAFDTDVVVGCDGSRSKTRQIIYPERTGATDLCWGGTWSYRTTVPFDHFRNVLGNDKGDLYGRAPQMFIGNGAFLVTLPLLGNDTVAVAAFVTDFNAPKRLPDGLLAKVEVTAAELQSTFAHFGPDARAVVQSVSGTMSKWALHYLSPPLQSYAKDGLCLVGDAAHGGLPHHGAMAGQAIEDALLLTRLLSLDQIDSPSNVYAALQAYTAIRAPRANSVLVRGLHARNVYSLKDAEIGADPQKLAAYLSTNWEWIWDHDHEDEFERAKQWLRDNTSINI